MRKFSATCRLKKPVPLSDLSESVLALVDAGVTTPGRIKSRWHKKLGNVVDLSCDFATEDRKAFEEHMADVHCRKSTRRAVWSTPSNELPYLATPLWRPRRLTQEGTPWIDDPKRPRTRACEACSTVYEIGVEHQSDCAAARGAA